MVFRTLRRSLFLFLFIPVILSAQDTLRTDTLSKSAPFVEDDPVVQMLDSLATLHIFEDGAYPNSNQYPNWKDFSDTDIPFFPDSVYRARIADMNDQSPFEYVYNYDVRKFIELYAVKKRKLTARILGLSQIYFPLFEEQLDKYNMPLELKYLAVIESALNPVANSRAGAKGLWQFMYGTGKVYGLKASSYVDDRFDPYKATIAACEHLQDLYDIYGNWSLALAAYNSGAGNVNKAIRRSGGVKNFWAIYNYLPKETRSYVPAFIAASYVMAYSQEHKIYPVDPGILYYEVDTVTVKFVLTFDQISEMLKIPYDEVEFLNPSFKQGVIPASPDHTYKIRLRKKYIGDFINNEMALYSYRTLKGKSQDSLTASVYNSYRETQLYTVKSGETISSIAKKFHMTTGDLKSMNNLRKNYVKPKQKLFVYTPTSKDKVPSSGVSSTYIPSDTKSNPTEKQSPEEETVKSPETEAPKTIHVVKSGESLGLIAGKYKCSVDNIKQWNSLKSSTIQVGQKLKVAPGASAQTTASRNGASQTSKSTTGSNQKYSIYTIQSGDNLWDIANKFDVTVAQLKNLNNLKNSSRLKPGQKLKIPK